MPTSTRCGVSRSMAPAKRSHASGPLPPNMAGRTIFASCSPFARSSPKPRAPRGNAARSDRIVNIGGDLEADVEDVFGTKFEERDGRKIPSSEDVSLSHGAVKVEATFLYADLAGSSAIAAACPWDTTAKILRAYLRCATRLMRAYGGEIRSFDGDRVMAVFMGDSMRSYAADCAREIYWTTENIIRVRARERFASIRKNEIKIHQACGIDAGTVRAVRAGIRNSNDLIWIGRAPSLAAKLSDIRAFPHCTFITKAVYDRLRESSKFPDGKTIWESSSLAFAGTSEPIYRSNWMKRP